jgi:TolB protein
MKPSHLILLAALGAALLAAGCGGEPTATVAATPTAAKAAAGLPGGRIAFRRYLDDAQTQGALFTVNPDGSDERQITHPAPGVVDDQPDWSHDGKRIAFEQCPGEDPCSVWTMRADGTHARKLKVRCTLGPICDAGSPSWMPDGRLIVGLAQGRVHFNGDLDQIERFSVELVDPRRHTQRTIVARDHWTGDTAEPNVSADGRIVLYKRWNSWTTKPSRGEALYAISINGTHHRRLTPWKLDAGDHAVLSPDGTRAFFRSFAHADDKQSDYYTVRLRDRKLTRLTHYPAGTLALSGSFSPDGKWIVHASDGVDDQADVVVMRADGTDQRPVTHTAAWDSAPDWGPAD